MYLYFIKQTIKTYYKMKNQNMKLIRKVNEEKYFVNYNDLYMFIRKSTQVSEEILFNNTTLVNTVVKPMLQSSGTHLIKVGSFLCQLTIGYFERTSGNYKYNLLSIQDASTLCYNDIKKLFNIQ